MDIERRTIASEATLEYREDPKTGEKVPVVVGYAAVFNSLSRNLGGFVEVLEPRAFDNVLRTNPDVVAVWNHNKDMPLGRVADGRLKLSVDPHGLRYEVTPNTKTSIGKDLTIWVEDRTVQASSFAFAVAGDSGQRWEPGPNGLRKRTITEVALLDDVSPVLRPAYDGTSVVVSRRALEMAAGEANRPNQTMSNAARKGLKQAEGRSDVDSGLVLLADRIAGRHILTFEEVAYVAAVMERCLKAKNPAWAGTPAWIEYHLAGGDSGQRWLQRRNEAEGVSSGVLEPRTAPNEPKPATSDTEERAADGIDLKPTAGMASAAARGLKLHEDGRSGDGLKPETVARAKRIAARETLTPSHVREMRAWFRRHKVDRRPGWDKAGEESPGFTAWLLWGGAPAWRWAEAKVSQMERASGERDEGEESLSPAAAALYEAYESIAEQYGPWSQADAHYIDNSPFKDEGLVCSRCAFYEAGKCEIVEGEIAADGICKLHIIVPSSDKQDEDMKTDARSADEPTNTAVETPPEAPQAPAAPTQQEREAAEVIAAIAAMDAAVLATHLHGSDVTS